MVLRLVKFYLVPSTLVVAALFGFIIYVNLEHNPQAEFCDYYVEKHWANYVKSNGEQCRIRGNVIALQSEFRF